MKLGVELARTVQDTCRICKYPKTEAKTFVSRVLQTDFSDREASGNRVIGRLTAQLLHSHSDLFTLFPTVFSMPGHFRHRTMPRPEKNA
jgi:hypothetical protein